MKRSDIDKSFALGAQLVDRPVPLVTDPVRTRCAVVHDIMVHAWKASDFLVIVQGIGACANHHLRRLLFALSLLEQNSVLQPVCVACMLSALRGDCK